MIDSNDQYRSGTERSDDDDVIHSLFMSMRAKGYKKTPSENLQNEYIKMLDKIDLQQNGTPEHHFNTVNHKF